MFESDNELDDDYLNHEALMLSFRNDTIRFDDTTTQSDIENESIRTDYSKEFDDPRLLFSNSHINMESNTSCSSSHVNRTVVQRKFPGPAGLPAYKRDVDTESNNKELDFNNVVYSQSSSKMFEGEIWSTMWNEHQHLSFGAGCLTERYTINWILTMIKLKISKVPFLAAIIEHVNIMGRDISNVSLTLKDMTGTIQAVMPCELYNKYVNYVKPQSVIVLANFGILHMLHNMKPLIIICSSNLLSLYAHDENKSIKKVNHLAAQQWNSAIGTAMNASSMDQNRLKRKRDIQDVDDRRTSLSNSLFNTQSDINVDDVDLNN